MGIASNIFLTLSPLMVQAGGAQGEGARNAAEGAASPDAVQVQSIWDFIEKGGIMMIPLGICSLIMIAVTIERLIVLRKGSIIPPGFLKDLEREMDRTEDNKAVLEFCNRNGSALAAVCAAGLKRRGMSLELIERHVSEAGEREVFKLRKYLRSLAVIAAIAPLMGLTGTIFGMIKAFQTVAVSADALGKTEMLATGIYEAMITTAAGLLVAIPALICYHFLSAKIEKRVAEMDALIVDFIEEHIGAGPAARAASGIDASSNGSSRESKPAPEPAAATSAGSP